MSLGLRKYILSDAKVEVTNDVQIVGGGRKRLSVFPYRKQLFVSRLTPHFGNSVFE